MSDPTVPPQQPQRRGCLFWGCLTCCVLLLLLVLAAVFTVRFVKNRINAYTDTAPMALPKVEMSDADFKVLQQRVKSFGDAMDQGKPTEPLSLSSDELNAIIVKSPNSASLSNKIHLSLNGSEVKGQISIPLDSLGRLGRGRYLNGEATFNASLENGILIVTTQDILVKGKHVPETVMSKLRHENLAKDAMRDPKNAEALRKLDSFKVVDGHVIIKAHTETNATPTATPATN